MSQVGPQEHDSTRGPELEAPAVRLARYLKEFVGLRHKTVRDVEKYEDVLWLGEIPRDDDCWSPAWTEEEDTEGPWLEVRKQRDVSAPDPPDEILPWIEEAELQNAASEMPPLRPVIHCVDEEVDTQDGEDPPLEEFRLEDYPEATDAYERFRPEWEAWARESLHRQAIQAVYAQLFRLHARVAKEGEVIEVVLGLGFLDGKPREPKNHPRVRRHCVTTPVEIEFDAGRGVMRVRPPGGGARFRIEDDMLEAGARPGRPHYDSLKTSLEEIGDDVWDRARIEEAFGGWVEALDPDVRWSSDLRYESGAGLDLTVTFAPAIILRRRGQAAMARVYDQMLYRLREVDGGRPRGWTALTTDSDDWVSDQGVFPGHGQDHDGPPESAEVYFPLLWNREQRQIVDAIGRRRGVLVQGPPGTGKSHTIANLICHLLALGRRVLVTAETDRALRVLRDKLPDEIQALCVSVLAQGGDAFAELNAAVQGIMNRHASYNRVQYQERIDRALDELDAARRRVARLDAEIRSLREGETCEHSVSSGAYRGTASRIAGRVRESREDYDWLSLPADATDHPPLSRQEVQSWLDLLRRYSDEEVSLAELRIPDIEDLLSPDAFARAVAEEGRAREATLDSRELLDHPAYDPLRRLDSDVRDQLSSDLRGIEEQTAALAQRGCGWIDEALKECLGSGGSRWFELRKLTESRVTDGEDALERVGAHSVDLPEGQPLAKIQADASTAAECLRSGGRWRRFGLLRHPALKGPSYLKSDAFVDGAPAVDAERLEIVGAHAGARLAIADLRNAWGEVGVEIPGEDSRLLFAAVRDLAEALSACLELVEACRSAGYEMARAPRRIPEPRWCTDEVGVWLAVLDCASREAELQRKVEGVDEAGRGLSSLCQLHDVYPGVPKLAEAVRGRNVTRYSELHQALSEAARTRRDESERARLEERIDQHVPDLSHRVRQSIDDPAWDERFQSWEAAWNWAVADRWLGRRSDEEYRTRVWEERREADGKIGRVIAETAALRAWTFFFERLSPEQAQALRGWREAVRMMGKGKGRSAKLARLRREAREYMGRCRDAIPAWIMPRQLVAEMVDPAPERFDVVIVDEASQLGVESLFLFYLARKIVVVGDDQQISPSGVGVPDDAIASLQRRYLAGFRHLHALSAQSSLYANAKIRFSEAIVLREHFRCMPEIIQFSNDLCYASNGTPLDPLRTYAADRLEPLVLRHVPDGYRTGGTQNAQNPPEVDAIVATIKACIDDPRYSGATMGVISLQGDTQARLIEQRLQEELEPETIEERRLVCGDAYAFQGDERRVIFLSMVAAVGETRVSALTTESARQRFNVAASRAQDQLWLFHTVTLDQLREEDMRARLLRYMHEPSRMQSREERQEFDSDFERDVFRAISARGLHVRTQVSVGDPGSHRYRIDLVVEGMQGRLAVECDGDRWHGPERYESDMARQRDLERAGWQFVRIRGGEYYRDPESALRPLWAELERLRIRPGAGDDDRSESRSRPATTGEASSRREPKLEPTPAVGTEDREHRDTETRSDAPGVVREPLDDAVTRDRVEARFDGCAGPDPRKCKTAEVAEGLRRIIEVEGPVVTKRVYRKYLVGCQIRRMGREIRSQLNDALRYAIKKGWIVKESEMGRKGLVHSTVRAAETPAVIVRKRGQRTLEEIPPSEIQMVGRKLAGEIGLEIGSEEHLRAILDYYEFKRLTAAARKMLSDALTRGFPHLDDLLGDGDA